jgi:hypothetical protein
MTKLNWAGAVTGMAFCAAMAGLRDKAICHGVRHSFSLQTATNLIYATTSDDTCMPQSQDCGTRFSLTTDGATYTQE